MRTELAFDVPAGVRRAACLLVAMACVALCSCASVKSEVAAPGPQAGLTYYLPKKDIRVTLTVAADKSSTVLADTTVAYADLSKRFRATFLANYLGKNMLNVAVTKDGLLTSATSKTTSEVNTALSNLATSIGTSSLTSKGPQTACIKPGTYTAAFSPPDDVPAAGQEWAKVESFCGFKIELRRLAATKADPKGPDAKKDGKSGFFYRVSEPYEVRISSPEHDARFTVSSPNHSDVHFLPVSKSFFSDNNAELTFDDGMPKTYKQEMGGEFVALFKLPADILSAYFGAIGTAFTNRKSAIENEKAYLESVQRLELQKLKLELCQKALATGTDEQKKAACQ